MRSVMLRKMLLKMVGPHCSDQYISISDKLFYFLKIRKLVAKIILCFLAGFLFAIPGQAQKKVSKKITAFIQEAEDALLRFDHQEAEAIYLDILKKKPGYAPAMRGLAIAYDLQGKYKESAELLEKIVQKNPLFSRVIYGDIAIAHYRYGNYQSSITYFNKFDSIVKLPVIDFGFNGQKELEVEAAYRSKLQENIRACEIAKDSIFSRNVLAVNNLESPINTSGNEYFPFLSNDQQVLYFTRQLNRFSDENLFYSRKDTMQWGFPFYIDSIFNTPVNEGMATFTRDGQQMFFTACQRKDVGGTCDIRKAFVQEQKVLEIQNLIGEANTEKWESQACISCDGSSLFFSSNRAGGYGKTDLYVSELQADGTWGLAKNLGKNINTDKDEESPFITNDGKTLFFSSTGHLGLGEQDLFMSRLDEQGHWGRPINLGPPVNTAYRELGFFLSADGLTGLFSSDRPKGKGNMDIYQFQLSQELSSEPITYVEGFVKDSITLAPVQTILYPKHHAPVPTDENGRFFLCLKADEIFDFNIEAKNYQPFSTKENIPIWDNKTLYQLEVLLQPFSKPEPPKPSKSIDSLLQVIYFDFDQADLNLTALQDLEKLRQQLEGRPIQKIEILGFCDYVGSASYNLDLSKKRAAAVADFLKQKGIINSAEAMEIIIQGSGELNEGLRKLNRRVEIRIY